MPWKDRPRFTHKWIEVTAEDIEHGDRYDQDYSPVALALRRAFPADKQVEIVIIVGGVARGRADEWLFIDQIEVVIDGKYYLKDAHMEDEILTFMDAWDAGEPVEPFSCQVCFVVSERIP